MAQARSITLCADDYGYRPGVSAAIRDLARRHRLTATSALVNFPDWPEAAAHVRVLREDADVGLHLNLVEGPPLGAMPELAPNGQLPGIGALARRALLARLPADEIRQEIRRQFEAFRSFAGVLPDFVDGHQHAHALSGIGQILLEVLSEIAPAGAIPVRDPADRLTRIVMRSIGAPKALAVALLTRGFGRRAYGRGVPINDGFSGFYDFSPAADLEAHFRAFLTRCGPRHLIMCHPGREDTTAIDPIAPARQREFDFLGSDAFPRLLARADASLIRFRPLVGLASAH